MWIPDLDEINVALARKSLLEFTKYTMPNYKPNWHHEVMCEYLDRFIAGEIKRLMIFAPPRHGKSEIVSRRLPAYILGLNPNTPIIAASYGADLARRMNRDVQRIIDSPEYRRVFPDTRLYGKNIRTVGGGSWLRNSDEFEVVEYGGYYRGAGVGGAITGMGMTCLPPDSLITTLYGKIKVETLVKLGVKPEVLSYNHDTRELEWKRIIATAIRPGKPIIEITLDSGHRMRCTADHLVYSTERGYLQAGNIVQGQTLIKVSEVQAMRDVRRKYRSRCDMQTLLPQDQINQVSGKVRKVWRGVFARQIRSQKNSNQGHGRSILFSLLQRFAPCRQESSDVLSLRQADDYQVKSLLQGSQTQSSSHLKRKKMRTVRRSVSAKHQPNSILHKKVCRSGALRTHDRQGQQSLQGWRKLRRLVQTDETGGASSGWRPLRHLRQEEQKNNDASPTERWFSPDCVTTCNSSYRPYAAKQQGRKPDNNVQIVPQNASRSRGQWQTVTVSAVTRISDQPEFVYDIQVEGNRNFFADEILVHNCGIIDDPVKNRQDASSVAVRQSLWDWYVSTFRTRLAPGGGILITVTTWHEDGLEARLLRLAESSATADQWTVIRLPAIAEEPIPVYDIRQIGEPLWPERYSLTEMEATKVTLGSYEWNALYQQRPSPDAGGILKRHWWRYWKPRGANLPPVLVKGEDGELVEIEAVELPSKFDEQLQSWDLTFKDTKGSDFVAGQVFGRKGANKYMLDYYKERADIGSTMEQIVKYTNKWPDATAKLIEDKANGPAVIQMLRHKVTGLIAVEPQGGKISRAHAAAPEVESGNVYLPHPALYPWVSDFIDSCAGFPNMANDDDVDAFTQAMIRMASKRTIDDFNIGSMTGTSKWRL
jgi:predicted phage terminase large subunit-like protein